MNAIVSAVLPVFLVAGAAYAIRRRFALDTKTLSTLNIYLLIPALVFANLAPRGVAWPLFLRIALLSVLMMAVMTALLSVLARWRNIAPDERGAFLMTMFPNLGNFGLPVCKFAFGDEGLALAVVVMICGSFLQNSVGIYFAQRARYGIGEAFRRVFSFPMIYAFVLALAVQRFQIAVPSSVFRAIQICGEAAIPIQLMILGVQLAETRLEIGANVFLASAMRLGAGPLLAGALVWAAGLHGLAGKVFIVEMSGPVAVGMAAYGVQFGVAPRFLASVVSWTFLFSLVTVSLVLLILSGINF